MKTVQVTGAATSSARRSNPEEIALVTGWDVKAVRAAIQAGQLPGCRFVPSPGGTGGRYLCAWAPFWTWFSEGVEVPHAKPDDTDRFIRRIRTLETIHELIESEAAS